MSSELKLNDVGHAYSETSVIDNISFELQQGEATALIGPNGAGKTTLLKIAANLIEPMQGTVELNDNSINAYSRKQIATQLSTVLPPKHYIFDYTALEFVLMGMYPQTPPMSLPNQLEHQQALRAMKQLDVAYLSEQPLSNLSEGERQRVVMARTILTGASIWLLDEPVNSLDPKHQVALLEKIREHVEHGKTTLAILHNLTLVHRYFDRVLILKKGELVADGEPDEVLTSKQLSDVYEVDLRKAYADSNVVWFVH